MSLLNVSEFSFNPERKTYSQKKIKLVETIIPKAKINVKKISSEKLE